MHLDILRSNIANHIFFSHENVGLHRFVQSEFSLHMTTTSTKKWLLHWIPFVVKGLHPYFFHHINDVVYKLQLLYLVVHFHCDFLVLDNYFHKMLAWYGHHDPLCSEEEQDTARYMWNIWEVLFDEATEIVLIKIISLEVVSQPSHYQFQL